MLIDDGVCIKWKRTIIIGQGDLFYKIISGEISTLSLWDSAYLDVAMFSTAFQMMIG